MDHLNKICDSMDEVKEVIEVFKDTDYILSTDRLNRIMRILTTFSTILMPFLIISSIYGMNVILPGGLEEGFPLSFVIIIAIMLSITGGMLWFFRRKRWI